MRKSIVIAAMLIGCYGARAQQKKDQLAERASFEFGCPKEKIEITLP